MDFLISLAATPTILSVTGDSAGAAASFASSLTLLCAALGAALRARPILRFLLRAAALLAALAAATPLVFFLYSKRASSAAPDVFLALCAGVGAVVVDAMLVRAISAPAERAAVAHVGVFALRSALINVMNDARGGAGSRAVTDAALGASSARALAGAAVFVAAGAALLARARVKDARTRALALAAVVAASLIPFHVPLLACATWVPGAVASRPLTVLLWCAACLALLPLPAARDAAGIVRARKVYHFAFACMVVGPLLISFRRGAVGVGASSSAADVSFVCAALAGALLGFVLLEAVRVLDVLPPRVSALVRERLHRHADARDKARGVLLPHIALVAGSLFPLLAAEMVPAVGNATRGLQLVRLIAAPVAVGVGDAMAAIVGLWSVRAGVARPWVGSKGKTVNGTAAFAISVLGVHVAILAALGGGGAALTSRTFMAAAASAVAGAAAEVLSGDVDNIVVPCAAWAAALLASK